MNIEKELQEADAEIASLYEMNLAQAKTIAEQAAEIERLKERNFIYVSRESEKRMTLRTEIATLQHKVKVLTDALESWKGIAENCSIEAGYCCCGEDMKTHSHPMSCGHSPVDMADEPVSRAMELTYKALATVKWE